MLKKLVKFGNSTALVIDKPILELLGMQESGMVYLHSTDGKSLTISPASEMKDKTRLAVEMIREKALENFESNKKEFDVVPHELQLKMQEEFGDIFKQHQASFIKFNEAMHSNLELKQAIEKLSFEFDPAEVPELYARKFNEIRNKFFPDLVKLDEGIEKISKKYSKI